VCFKGLVCGNELVGSDFNFTAKHRNFHGYVRWVCERKSNKSMTDFGVEFYDVGGFEDEERLYL
jgi:hypothetical protein